MKVVCLECGTDGEVQEGEILCPTCRTPLSQFVNVPSTAGFQRHQDNITPMTDSGKPPPGAERMPERVGKYEILAKAGAGGMGVVYKARDKELDRIVALKVMIAGEHATAETIQRFQREAKSAAKLAHPNIVHVYDVGVDATGLYYFAMEFVDGSPLDRLIKEKGIDGQTAARIGRDLARALQYAHDQGIIHRDLKPANVMVDRSGAPRLTDFGLAKAMSDEGSLTRAGEIMGTACYMPPEQASGMRDVDTRSDVYSLGAVLYEMLTRRPPFIGETVVAILRKVEEDDPAPPTEIVATLPRDLVTICLKAMSKEKDRRYDSAGAMALDLERFLDGQPIAAQRSGILHRSTKWARRHPAGVTAVAMTVIGALIIGAILSRPAPVAPPPDPGPDKHAMRTRAEPFYRAASQEVDKARRFLEPKDRKKRMDVYRGAQASLDKAVETFAEYAEAFHLRGVVDVALNQRARAMDDFNQALKLDPTIADAYYERVQLRLRDVSDKIARGLPFVEPADATELFGKEKALIREDIAAIRKSGQRHERALVAEAGVISTFYDEGDAIALLDQALDKDPTFSDALVLRATQLMQKGGERRLTQALEDLGAAIRYDANNVKAFKARGALHLLMGKPDLALSDLNEMVAIAPDEGQSYLDRASILLSANVRRKVVRTDLATAVKLDPKNPMALFLDAYYQLTPTPASADAVTRCRLEFEQAIACDPAFVPAYVFRMVCDYLLFDEALPVHTDEFNKIFARIPAPKRDRVTNYVGTKGNELRAEMGKPATVKLFDSGLIDLTDSEEADAEQKFTEVLRRIDDALTVSREGIDPRTVHNLRSQSHYNLACVFARRKEIERAFPSLESAFRINADLARHAQGDTDLDNLRDDPRFAALLKRFRKE